jgi:hypothetical protein
MKEKENANMALQATELHVEDIILVPNVIIPTLSLIIWRRKKVT